MRSAAMPRFSSKIPGFIFTQYFRHFSKTQELVPEGSRSAIYSHVTFER